jgi:hypothetical protein
VFVLETNFRLVWLCAAVMLGVTSAGCESSSSSSSSSGDLPDGGTFDSGGSSSGDVDSGGSDGGGNVDAGSDAGGGFTEPGVGLANFHDTPLDICFKATGAADFTGPLYGAEGGVPIGSMGVVRPVPIEAQVKFIVAGSGCAANGIYTPGSVTSKNTPRVITIVRAQPLDDARLVIMRPAQHVAGKDNVYYGRLGRDATFTPAGGAATTIEEGKVTALAPNLTGTLTLSAPAGDYTKQMKTGSGVMLIIETPSTILLCDLLAAPSGHLAACGDPVRAP